MTLRQLNDELLARGVELSKDALYALAKLVPGGSKQALRPGSIPSWSFPDDALERITPELLEQALSEARPPAAAPATTAATSTARAGVSDDEAELRRDKVKLERDSVAFERMELDDRRAERERKRGGSNGGLDATALLLLDRLNAVERKLDGARGTGGSSDLPAMITALAPVLTALVAGRPGAGELLAQLAKAQPDPLAVARQLKDLGLVPGQDAAGALGRARELLELVTMLRPLVGGREDGNGGFWAETARLLAPRVPDMLGKVVDGARDIVSARARAAESRRGSTPAPASPNPALVQLQQELAAAAARYDTDFFPTLRERIAAIFPQGGAELLEAVSVNASADRVALERLREAGIQLTAEVVTYLQAFAGWLRFVRRQEHGRGGGGAAPSAANGVPSGVVFGRCQRCATAFSFEDEGQFQQDTKVCDVNAGGVLCGGQILRVSDGAPAAS